MINIIFTDSSVRYNTKTPSTFRVERQFLQIIHSIITAITSRAMPSQLFELVYWHHQRPFLKRAPTRPKFTVYDSVCPLNGPVYITDKILGIISSFSSTKIWFFSFRNRRYLKTMIDRHNESTRPTNHDMRTEVAPNAVYSESWNSGKFRLWHTKFVHCSNFTHTI